MEVLTLPIQKTFDVHDATFARPDLTTSAGSTNSASKPLGRVWSPTAL